MEIMCCQSNLQSSYFAYGKKRWNKRRSVIRSLINSRIVYDTFRNHPSI